MSLQLEGLIDDKYRVIRLLGEGGMGAVYLGENIRIRRQVAIKVLHARVARDTEVVHRFEREAQAAGCIGNDHILEVLDIGALPDGERYIVMEFLDGEPLSVRLERVKRLPPGELVHIAFQLLDGLAAAHRAGITHRDLKPDNVYILKQKAGHRDFVKIIDFGISKFARADGSVKMTRAGSMMGTPLYMSPEQAKSSEADARSDIYAVGVILYEAAAGRVPFTAQAFNELLFQIVLGDITPLHVAAPDVDPAFSAIVAKAMAKEPVDRFQTADEFRHVLDEWRARMGYPRPSSIAPTASMIQTPWPGPRPDAPAGAWTPYPNPGTPHPHPGTPYPHPGTPNPHSRTPQPKGQTPYPDLRPGQTPFPPGGWGQGSSHAWGALHSPAPAGAMAAKPSKRLLVASVTGVVAILVVTAFGLPRVLRRGESAARATASGGAPPAASREASAGAQSAGNSLPAAPSAAPGASAVTVATGTPPRLGGSPGGGATTTHQASAIKPAVREAKPAAPAANGSKSSVPDFGY